MEQHPKKGVLQKDNKRHMDLLREKHQSTSHKQKQLTLVSVSPHPVPEKKSPTCCLVQAAIMNDTDYLLTTCVDARSSEPPRFFLQSKPILWRFHDNPVPICAQYWAR